MYFFLVDLLQVNQIISISGLFNDALSKSDYIALNDRRLVNTEL